MQRHLTDIIESIDSSLPKDQVLEQLKKFTKSSLTAPKVCGQRNRTPLMGAIRSGNPAVMEWVLTPKRDLGWGVKDLDNMTPFMHAVNYTDSKPGPENKNDSTSKQAQILSQLMKRINEEFSLDARLRLFKEAIETIITKKNWDGYQQMSKNLWERMEEEAMLLDPQLWDYPEIKENLKHMVLKFFYKFLEKAMELNSAEFVRAILTMMKDYSSKCEDLCDNYLVEEALKKFHLDLDIISLMMENRFHIPLSIITQLLEIQHKSAPEQFKQFKDIYCHINKNKYKGLDITIQSIIRALSLPHNSIETAYLILDSCTPQMRESFNKDVQWLTMLLECLHKSTPEEFDFFKKIMSLLDGTRLTQASEHHLKLAFSLPHHRTEMAALLLDEPLLMLSFIKKQKSVITMLLEFQQKATPDEFEFYKKYLVSCWRQSNKTMHVCKRDLELAYNLPHNSKETLSLLLVELQGLHDLSVQEVVDVWKTNNQTVSDLLAFLTDLPDSIKLDLDKYFKLAMQLFQDQDLREVMQTHIINLLESKITFTMEHLKQACASNDDALLKLILYKSVHGSWNSGALPEEMALKVWRYPDAALRFIEVKAEKPAQSYSPLTALLKGYRQSKTKENWKEQVAPAIERLFQAKMNTVSKEDWDIAIELAEEPLLNKLIEKSNGDLTMLFELAIKNGNPNIIDLVIHCRPEIQGNWLNIALQNRQFSLLKKLLKCTIKPNTFEFNIEMLLNFYQQAKEDKSILLSQNDMLEILDLLEKLLVPLNFNCLSKIFIIGDSLVIDKIIQIIKAQKNPTLSELLKHAVSQNSINYTEELLRQGAIVGSDHWKEAILHDDNIIFNFLLSRSEIEPPSIDLLDFAAKNGRVNVVKKLLERLSWKPYQLHQIRKPWVDEEKEHQRISRLLWFSAKDLDFISNDKHLKDPDFSALTTEDKDFITTLIQKKAPQVELANALQQLSTQSTEPKLEVKLEGPTNASAPPLPPAYDDDNSEVVNGEQVKSGDVNPEILLPKSQEAPTSVPTLSPVAKALPVMPSAISPLLAPSVPHVQQPSVMLSDYPKEGIPHLPLPEQKSESVIDSTSANANQPRSLSGQEEGTPASEVKSKESPHMARSMFNDPLLNKLTKRELIVKLGIILPACVNAWQDDPVMFDLFSRLNAVLPEEFDKVRPKGSRTRP